MTIPTTIFCKPSNSVNSDSDDHLYITTNHMNNKNLPNSLFAFRKVRIFSAKKLKQNNNNTQSTITASK